MYYVFTAESDGGRILKIGQHLAKLWTRVGYPAIGLIPAAFAVIMLGAFNLRN